MVGERSKGDWKLEVMDNRAGPFPVTNLDLVSWQLSLTLDTVTPFAIPLSHAVPVTNSVDHVLHPLLRGERVPAWAAFATNTLFNVSGGPVNLLTGTRPSSPPAPGDRGLPVVQHVLQQPVSTLTTNGPASPSCCPALLITSACETRATKHGEFLHRG